MERAQQVTWDQGEVRVPIKGEWRLDQVYIHVSAMGCAGGASWGAGSGMGLLGKRKEYEAH